MDAEERSGCPVRHAAARPPGSDVSLDHGFTLLEVLLAVVLVGVLSAVAVVGVGRLTDQAATASCDASADASRLAASTYYADNLRYPTSFAELTATTGGASGALVLTTGVTITDDELDGGSWRLTLVPGNPPTFSCSTATAGTVATSTGSTVPTTATTTSTSLAATTTIASTTTAATTTTATTTTAATTTTVALANGVTAVASIAGDQRYFGEHILKVTNTSPMTDLTVTINVRKTAGISVLNQYTDSWGGTVDGSASSTGGDIVYRFTIVPGRTIVAGTWKLAGQWSGTGSIRPVTGDTWSVTTTSQGRTSTISGGF